MCPVRSVTYVASRSIPLSLFCHLATIHRLATIELLSWGYDYIASVISRSAKQGFYLLVQPRQLVIIRHGECVIAPAEPEFRTLARPTSSHAKSAKNSFLFSYLAHPGHGTRPSSARPT